MLPKSERRRAVLPAASTPDEAENWRDLYERLAKATPDEKTDIVVRLIEEQPEDRLELPEGDGMVADLNGPDFSRGAFEVKLAQ